MKTLINFVLDMSGSMGDPIYNSEGDVIGNIRDDTIAGFNEYIDGLRKQGGDICMTLTIFNSHQAQTVFIDRPVSEVPHLTLETYFPRGGTPLYDAIGSTIKALEKRDLSNVAVLLIVMTDGEENSSIRYTKNQILKIIAEKKEQHGWTFATLGADADTWEKTQAIKRGIMDLGISDGNYFTYGRNAPREAIGSLAGATCMYMASGGEQTENFFAGMQPVGESAKSDPTVVHIDGIPTKSQKRSRPAIRRH